MTKVVVPDIDSGYNLTAINEALNSLANELNTKVLYRDNPAGEPNAMNNLLDMNSKQIINLPAPATQNSPARLRDVQAAITGLVPASLIPFTPAGTISSTTVQSAIEEVSNDVTLLQRVQGVYARNYPGYDPTGVGDSTAAIQAAINAANASGVHTVWITGKARITAPLTYSVALTLIGSESGDTFTNSADSYANGILCGGVTGYIFDQPDVLDGSGKLTLQNLAFDGRVSGTNSTTLQGIVRSSTTVGQGSFFLRMTNCMVRDSNSPTAILELSGQVFARIENCFFGNWPFGMGHRAGASGILATTITFDKCYWNSLRQVGEWIVNTTDVTYNDCVMESCVVGVAGRSGNFSFNNLYSENMGSDPTATGITTGITPRSLGITDSPAISGNVSAVFTCRYGQMIFNQPTFQTSVGGKKWFDGIGRGSGSGSGGCITINDISFAGGVINTLFTADGDTPSSKANFEYNLTARAGQLYVAAADARLVSKGRAPILWSDTNSRVVDIEDGLFTIPPLQSAGITARPTIAPSGGVNVIGDRVKMAMSQYQRGVRTSYRCVVGGDATTSRWMIDDFIPSSTFASVAASGTTTITASAKDNPGELHIWEITASSGAGLESWYRLSVQAFSGAGQIGSEGIVTTRGLTFAMTWGDPYTITITNASAVPLSIYARLVSVSNTHAA